jgi:putative ABC transport system ATP-binding protein
MQPSGPPHGGVPVTCIGLTHVYKIDSAELVALADVNISIAAGEAVALFGPSGSGKSTLMALLAGLRRPTTGEIWLGDDELSSLTERELLVLRGRKIGVVVQNPSRSLLLRQLGLEHLAGQRAARLSGGEQQRLSIAVAMATLPRLLLADEPTSQLDGASRDLVIALFERIVSEFGATMAVVTHDPVVADATVRRITLSEGRVVTPVGQVGVFRPTEQANWS